MAGCCALLTMDLIPAELWTEIVSYTIMMWQSVDRSGYIESLSEYGLLQDLGHFRQVNSTSMLDSTDEADCFQGHGENRLERS